MRESPALDVIELLRVKGADVRYHDPYVPIIRHNGFEMTSAVDLNAALAAADCAVGDLAPRIHALLRLAERADLSVSEPQRLFLARFDQYQLEGRYPDMLPMAPDIETARNELRQAQEMFEWLIQQL